MNNSVRGALFFILGAASASFITYKVVEKKFKKIADEEIESVKEMYERKMKKVELDKNETPFAPIYATVEGLPESRNVEPAWPKQNPYTSLVNDLGYSNDKKEEEEVADNNIQVIPPEDFGEYGYDTESLTYYDDKVLAYDNDEKITDIDKIVGSDALNSFGEYEDDSVFVRNHSLKTDYEILKDNRKYSVVVGTDADDDE